MGSLRFLAVGLALLAAAPAPAAELASDYAVNGVRGLIDDGSHDAALRSLDRLLAIYPQDPRLAGLRAQVRAQLERELNVATPPKSGPAARPLRLPPIEHAAADPGRHFTVPTGAIAMIWIRPGTFLMSRLHDSDDDTQVTHTRGYWIGRTEVTQEQWQAVMENIPVPSFFKGSERPVERVAWVSAIEFCRKLSALESAAGRLPKGYDYTLPTEAQWEYACRAGTTGSFAGDIAAMGWHAGNSGGQSHPVGQKQPNAWGLYDMHGNVWEWCLDGFGGYPGGHVLDWWADYSGPSAATHRIIRGGAWGNPAGACRSNYRDYALINQSNSGAGFRLVLTPSTAATGKETSGASGRK